MTTKTVEELEGELSEIKEELADTKVQMKELLLLCNNISKGIALEKLFSNVIIGIQSLRVSKN